MDLGMDLELTDAAPSEVSPRRVVAQGGLSEVRPRRVVVLTRMRFLCYHDAGGVMRP